MTSIEKQTEKQTTGIWPIRGVRVDGDKVIITVRGGNDTARWLCGELLETHLEVKPLTDEQAHQTLLDMAEHIESFGTTETTDQQLSAECIRFILERVTHSIKEQP